MNERLQELLTRERLTAIRFSELVDVQRSSVSHVLSGRNKPSLDFMAKILSAFPHVSPDWLILGQGNYKRAPAAALHSPVKEREGQKEPAPPAGDVSAPNTPEEVIAHPAREEARAPYGQRALFEELPRAGSSAQRDSSPDTETKRGLNPDTPRADPDGGKRVVKMVFFYADRTFEVYLPGDGA